MSATVWGAVVFGMFQYDDYANVVTDPATKDLGTWWVRVWGGFRPLTRTSLFIDHALWGMAPGGFLFTNLVLHLATVAGVYRLASSRLGERSHGLGAPFVAALVFSLQPAHAETIAYVSGRSTALMACLLVWALVAHDQARGRASWAALAMFAAAVLAKEVALVFPLLVWAWDACGPRAGQGRAPLRAGWVSVRPYLVATALAGCVILISSHFRDLLSYSFNLRSPFENLLLQVRAVPETLSLWVRPWALSPIHTLDPVGSWWAWLLGAATLSALLALAVRSHRHTPMLSLAITWALIALIPTHSVIAKIDVISEKPLYLAWVGPALCAGWLWMRVAQAPPALAYARRRTVATALALALGVAGVACTWRVRVWSDDRLLWASTVRESPQSTRAWNNLGLALVESEPAVARSAFHRALELNPDNHYAAENLQLSAVMEDR